jgi:ribosome-binding protein aMBF1 (putative translation factor)
MPLKKQTAGRFVEINLKIAKKKFPLVSEALTAVLALAGQQMEKPKAPKAAKAKTAPARKAGSKAKAAPTRPGKSKSRRAEKKPVSSETAAMIRDLRVNACLSQKALAAKSGVSQNQISLLETGKQRLNLTLAKKLGRLFNTSIPTES